MARRRAVGRCCRATGLLTLVACLPATPAWADPADAGFLDEHPTPTSSIGTTRSGDNPPGPCPANPGHCSPTTAIPLSAPAGWTLASSQSEVQDSALPPDSPTEQPARSPAPELIRSGQPTPTGHVPRTDASHPGFFRQAGSVKTELAIMGGYLAVQTIPKLFKKTASFHFKDEGWFGRNTNNIGMDKLTHAFNTYLIAEILHARIHKNTGGSEGDALTAGILAFGLMAINEISDGIEADSGYSMNDILMNVAGASFSVLRNTVPGLKDKLAFKVEIMPNDEFYSHEGKKHFQQERFMLSLKGAGFETLERTPFKYLDFQIGYYASDFLNSDRAQGIRPKKHLFAGVGLNLGELLFGRSQSRAGRAAHSALDYFQFPYTSLRFDTKGRLAN